ncbi:phage tail tape measure protein [Rahnella variigena]|uniref:phage tail tape measure protein n=1 Tax=Rahnella variigena TaxID=574964 RepID=UPI00101DCC4A|nr:phage tail tape measure protein [Rahnella variigena]RYJ18001.1 phage tail tape measure protein [Rahnella variigena]
MASKSLGTLTIDLVAQVGGFVSGMDRASRAADKWAKEVQADSVKTAKAIASVGAAAYAAATAVGVAGFNLLKTTSEQITETDRWAKSLKISTQELLAWQFAAEKAGVSGDNMADIFKDIGDKIGDTVLNKSGEAVDALNALGLSADKLSKVSPDKQLLAIGSALGKIGTNAGKITILESLGNDLSKLLPLFDNNNEKLTQFIQLAKDYGIAPDPSQIDDLVKVNSLFEDMEAQVKGLKIEIAAGLANVDLSPLQGALHDLKDVLTDPAVLQGLSSLVQEIAQLAGWMIKAAAAAGDLAVKSGNRIAALGGNIDTDNLEQVNERIGVLQKIISDRQDSLFQKGQSVIGWLTDDDDSVDKLKGDVSDLIKLRDKLLVKKNTSILPTNSAVVAGADFALAPGQVNGKVTPDAGAKKLDNAFKSTEQNYLRQIALIDTTGKKTVEVTEAQKLQFDLASGKLVGINAEQQKRLESLAAEVDQLEKLKKANQENAKAAAFAAGLSAENRNAKAANDIDIQGAGLGDQERDRLKELLNLQRDYLDKHADLQKQYQGGDISKDLYDQETSALESALQERLELQKKHYEDLDALRVDWVAGISDAWQNFADEATNYSQIAADNVSSLLGSTTSSLSDGLYDIITSTESVGDALSNMAVSFGQSVIKALTDMAAQWLVYQAVQLAVGKATQASAIPAMIANAQATAFQAQLAAFASTAAIPIVGPALAPAAAATAAAYSQTLVAGVSASALSGMAHDGIDAVPETGTWLLQKGERVTTASTSAKLDATLDRVSSQSAGNAVPTINIPTTVNGDLDARTLLALKETQRAAVKEALDQSAYQIATGRGNIGKAVGTGWQTKRRTG